MPPTPVETADSLPTGEAEGNGVTPSKHKRTPGWPLHTTTGPSHLKGAGTGLFMAEKAKKNERIARYYGELIGPEEAEKRQAAGAQYIVRANAKQYLDAECYPNQRGRYANDGGARNNARISTTLNVCAITGLHWVSILARRAIPSGAEVLVPYGRSFRRAWKSSAPPAMAMLPGPSQHGNTDQAHAGYTIADEIGRAHV